MGTGIRRLVGLNLWGALLLSVLFSAGCRTVNHSRYADPDDPQAETSSRRDPAGVNAVTDPHFLMWPVARHNVTQDFRMQENSRGRTHDGIDISVPRGTRIYAPANGTVIYAGSRFHGYGKMIMIEHTPVFTTLLAHCQKIYVRTGEPVKRGELIALVGRTGHATAPHLHFEVRYKRDPVNPIDYLENN